MRSLCGIAVSVVAAAVLVLAVGYPSRAETQDIDLKTAVDEALLRWQRENRIEITTDAKSMVEIGFVEQKQYLRGIVVRQSLMRDRQMLLFGTLVEEYLYELRDKKIAEAQKTRASGNASGHRWMSQARVGGQVTTIEAEDVEKFSVSQFFRQMKPVLDGPPTGRLEVTSAPDQASITIDGKRAGNTCKTRVVSIGEHEVTVLKTDANLNCRARVSVGDGETKRVCCPSKSRCANWPDGDKCSLP